MHPIIGGGIMSEIPSSPKRQYPAFYEKFIPVAIGILAIVVLGMLLFTIAVGLGALKFG